MWIDAHYHLDGFARRAAVKTLGARKCLYGTDGPYAKAIQEKMVRKIERMALSDEAKERILGGNFQELINI